MVNPARWRTPATEYRKVGTTCERVGAMVGSINVIWEAATALRVVLVNLLFGKRDLAF